MISCAIRCLDASRVQVSLIEFARSFWEEVYSVKLRSDRFEGSIIPRVCLCTLMATYNSSLGSQLTSPWTSIVGRLSFSGDLVSPCSRSFSLVRSCTNKSIKLYTIAYSKGITYLAIIELATRQEIT